jgi:hypothetical protein
MIQPRPWIVAVACGAIAITLLYWLYPSKTRLDPKKLSAAEDEVYAAVVRDMFLPSDRRSNVSQLVFGDTLGTYVWTGSDSKSCEENAREQLRLEDNSPPPFNSFADKAYRVLSGGWYDSSLSADTIQDFVQKSCTGGRLSTTFHTDLPRTFVARESVRFRGSPVEKDESKSFQNLYPGASGIILFSHVGFDSTLDEALVSASFVCGGFCGGGRNYIVRKTWGKWEVANSWLVWVS